MSRNIIKLMLLFTVVVISIKGTAQENDAKEPKLAPIPLEVTLGEEGWTSQLIIDKNFENSDRFGIFSLTYLRANYDNDEYLRESLNLTFLKYDIVKGLSILSGAAYSSHWGFRPYAGGQYAYHTKTFMCALISGVYLTESHNYEAIAMVEYRPEINKMWSLYSRVQGLYNQNSELGKHDRSHAYGRLGVSYKAFSFGGAFNYDCYGPMKIKDHQWGIFVSTLLW